MPGGSILRGILLRFSAGLPCRIIVGPGGVPYLERYFLFRVPGRRGRPLLQVYLHRFVSSDPDRGLHDHPWPWAAPLVLAGGYTEERLTGLDEHGAVTRRRRIGPGRIAVLRGSTFHRVVLPDAAWEEGLEGNEQRCPEAWSLFAHGPFVKPWGFLRTVCVGFSGALRIWPAKQSVGGDPWWRAAPPGRDHPDRLGPDRVRRGGAVYPKGSSARTML